MTWSRLENVELARGPVVSAATLATYLAVIVGATAVSLVGSMLLHADGIDFHVLRPTWLAIALFIALPALFGLTIGPVVDRVERAGPRSSRGWKRWVLPVVLVALFPPTLFVLAFATSVLAAWLMIRSLGAVELLRASTAYSLVVRATWLIIAALGLVALVDDINAIT